MKTACIYNINATLCESIREDYCNFFRTPGNILHDTVPPLSRIFETETETVDEIQRGIIYDCNY